jgi:predicted nucleic acid-binding protein
MVRSSLLLLDACAVVNLYASRKMPEILAVIDGTVAIVDTVEREAQYVLRGGKGDDAREREPVELRPLIATGALSVIASDDEAELLTFIDLTQDLDEGEAMTAAIAIHRGAAVVTDDRKAARILGDRGVACQSTLGLLKAWADAHALADIVIRRVLTDLRERGTYEPPRAHPLRGWWNAIISSG